MIKQMGINLFYYNFDEKPLKFLYRSNIFYTGLPKLKIVVESAFPLIIKNEPIVTVYSIF